jgi:hypothetical protein
MRAKRQNGRDKDRSLQAKAIPGRVRLNHVKVPQTLPSQPDLIREKLLIREGKIAARCFSLTARGRPT